MKVKITKESYCGNVVIPPNDYWVSLHASSGCFYLSAGNQDIKIKAICRSRKAKVKVSSVYLVGGAKGTSSIVYADPKLGEWVAMLETESRDGPKRD